VTNWFTRSRQAPKIIDKVQRLGVARGLRYVEAGGCEYLELGRIATTDEAREGDAGTRADAPRGGPFFSRPAHSRARLQNLPLPRPMSPESGGMTP